jgi:hypothetical protein
MTDAKKPKPQVIECPTCHGAGTTTRRTVDGEVPDAECWKCLGTGWITQLPHAEGEGVTRTTMPSQAEQAQARARGDGMQADHTATLPNAVFNNWPGDRDGLYRWLLARHYGEADYRDFVRTLSLSDCAQILEGFQYHEQTYAKELEKEPLHHVARGLRDACRARVKGRS